VSVLGAGVASRPRWYAVWIGIGLKLVVHWEQVIFRPICSSDWNLVNTTILIHAWWYGVTCKSGKTSKKNNFFYPVLFLSEPWYLSQCSVWLRTGRPGFDPRQRIFLLASASTPALGPTQPPVQYRGSIPRGKARPGRDADHSLSSSAEVENEQELYLLSPQAPSWRVVGHLYLFFFTYLFHKLQAFLNSSSDKKNERSYTA
jgi:hypothetical protein